MLNSLLQQYIHKSKYARYIDEKQRRETWEETVDRYFSFAEKHISDKFGQAREKWLQAVPELKQAMLDAKIVPSMRLMMTAGKAAEKEHAAAYNCFFAAVNKKRRFSDTLYILLNGTGVGFSCERQDIARLPVIPDVIVDVDDVIVVKDSKIGWATAYRKLIDSLYHGEVPKIDYSKIRPAGSRLKTFGGRASGPQALKEMFDFTINIFKKAHNRKLTSLEVHDIFCKIAESVIVGGVRRSALISLSNLSDRRMREAKSGQWWTENPQRMLANNSAVYTEKPDIETFTEEWLSLIKSKSGERGIFNREAAKRQASKFGKREYNVEYGCNPCSEIILHPDGEFCNLTEVVVRHDDTLESLKKKVELCTILGTFQSTLTDFKFIDPAVADICNRERLLGVSMTGIMDHPVLNNVNDTAKKWLNEFRDYSEQVNKEWAEYFEINQSVAINCVKPSGTVSLLTDAGTGGLHPRFSQYYIRNVRQDVKDPLTNFLKEQGIYWEPCSMKPDNQVVFSFPVKGPEDAVFRDSRSAIDQLEHWLMFQREYCHHKPSITVYVKDEEWLEVGAWVYKNFDEVSGVAFLPYSDHVYKQAPFTPISEEEYNKFIETFPTSIDWDSLKEYDDLTEGAQELACTGGSCTI